MNEVDIVAITSSSMYLNSINYLPNNLVLLFKPYYKLNTVI